MGGRLGVLAPLIVTVATVVSAASAMMLADTHSIYAAQVQLPPEAAARVGGTSVSLATRYPVVVDRVSFYYQGSPASDLVDTIEVQLRLLDPAYSGTYFVGITVVIRDQLGNTVFAGTGTLTVTLSTTGVVVTGSLPQPVTQDAISYIHVRVWRQ